jgi:hypothetical protein
MSIDELHQIKNLIDPDVRINVSGGEPTCHPNFVEFCKTLRTLFPHTYLRMMSNGHKAEQYKEVILSTFDSVVFTDYPGGVHLIPGEWSSKVKFKRMNHRLISKTGGVVDCPFKQFPMVRDFRIHSCCRIFGLMLHQQKDPEGYSVPLSEWEHLIGVDEATCKNCWTSPHEKMFEPNTEDLNRL